MGHQGGNHCWPAPEAKEAVGSNTVGIAHIPVVSSPRDTQRISITLRLITRYYRYPDEEYLHFCRPHHIKPTSGRIAPYEKPIADLIGQRVGYSGQFPCSPLSAGTCSLTEPHAEFLAHTCVVVTREVDASTIVSTFSRSPARSCSSSFEIDAKISGVLTQNRGLISDDISNILACGFVDVLHVVHLSNLGL